MSRRRSGGLVMGLTLTAGMAMMAPAARAQDAPPESPPPAFVAPPPGYEPPTQYAQGAPPAAAPAGGAEAAPTFFTLDRFDGTTRFGLQMGWDKIDRVQLSDGFVMRYEPYGQYVFPNNAIGLYGQVPITHLFNFNGADAGGLGNIELGGFFMPTHSSELILRAGMAMATASNSPNDEIANIYGTFERFTDLLLVAPSYTTLRLSASTVQQRDMLFFRADLGFDLAVDKPSNANTSVYFRGNLALGIRAPSVDFTLELVNLAAVNGDVSGGIEGRFMHTAGFSLRTQGENQLHLGTVFPLDHDFRGEIWIISLGYQRAVTM